MVSHQYSELSNEQRRQLVDVMQVFAGYYRASKDFDQLGSLHWQSSKGNRYLYEKRHGLRKSLGRETPALVQRKADHDLRRKTVASTSKGLRTRLDRMAPVNRALNLGRLPTIAARILRELDREHWKSNLDRNLNAIFE